MNKRLLFFSVVIGIVTSSYSITIQQVSPDSQLQQLYNEALEINKQYLDEYSENSLLLQKTKFEQVYNLAQQQGNITIQLAASVQLLDVYYAFADNLNIQKHLEFCLLHEPELSIESKIIVFHYTGLFLRRNNDVANALYYQNLYYETAKSNNNKTDEVKALIEMAVLYRESQHYNKVKSTLDKVNKIIKSNSQQLTDIDDIKGYYYLHLGYYYYLQGDTLLAFKNYAYSKQYLTKSSLYYVDLAEIEAYLYENDLENSHAKLKTLINKDFNSFKVKAEILKNYGHYLIKSGQPEIAKSNYLKSFEIYYKNHSHKYAIELGKDILNLDLRPDIRSQLTQQMLESYHNLNNNKIEYNLFLIQLNRIRTKNQALIYSEKKIEKQNYTILIITIALLFILAAVVIVSLSLNKLKKQSYIINKQNLQIQDKNKKLEYFAYVLAHDLKNLLSSNLFITEYFSTKDIREKKLFNQLRISNKSGLKLLTYLLNEATGSSKKKDIKNVDFDAVLNDVLNLLENKLKENNIILQKNELKQQIPISENQLYQLLLNIIDNSIKYKDYRKNNHYINLNFEYNTNTLTLIFEDNGLGISQENIEKITNPYVQENETQGVGLGLYIVKEIVDKYNGNIKVISEKNVFTKLIVKLPLKQ